MVGNWAFGALPCHGNGLAAFYAGAKGLVADAGERELRTGIRRQIGINQTGAPTPVNEFCNREL